MGSEGSKPRKPQGHGVNIDPAILSALEAWDRADEERRRREAQDQREAAARKSKEIQREQDRGAF